MFFFCFYIVYLYKNFFLIVWNRMWLIFECDIFYSCFDFWIVWFNIVIEIVLVIINMLSLNFEVLDFLNICFLMLFVEFFIFFVFKMIKGCVMFKVKWYVSIYLNIFIYLVWVIKLLMCLVYYILSLSLFIVCFFCK